MNMMPIDKATEAEYDYTARTETTNNALKITVLALSAVIVMMGFQLVRAAKAVQNVPPRWIRINAVGEAQTVDLNTLDNKLKPPEVWASFRDLTKSLYGRNHRTDQYGMRQQYINAMQWMDTPLFHQIDDEDRKTMWLPKYLKSSDDEVDINVLGRPVIENLVTEPFRVRVEFEKVFRSLAGIETRRENWTAVYDFTVNPHPPNYLLDVDPIAIAVTNITLTPGYRDGQQ